MIHDAFLLFITSQWSHKVVTILLRFWWLRRPFPTEPSTAKRDVARNWPSQHVEYVNCIKISQDTSSWIKMIQRCGFNQSISLWNHVLHRQRMTVNRNPGIGAPKEWPWDLCFPIELECSCWKARPLCTTLLKLQQNGHCDTLWHFEVSRLVMMHRNRKTMFLMLCDPPQNECTSLPHGLLLMGMDSLLVLGYSGELGPVATKTCEHLWKLRQCSAQGSWEAHDELDKWLQCWPSPPWQTWGICKW